MDRGCRLTIVPAQTSAEDVLKMNPDGIFLSNGPGDPAPCDYAITAIQKFLETDIPVFGICLGHQLLALASGAKTVKMKFGHHGGNHPVKDVEKNVVMITAQNHGFAVDDLTIVPAQTSAEDVLKMNPDGIFLSNGPGDPAPCDYAITAIQKYLETDIPVFGICLGHQLLALASGAKTVKMKFGHHGGNHPVKDLEQNVVMITAKIHGFAVDEGTLAAHLRVTVREIIRSNKSHAKTYRHKKYPDSGRGPDCYRSGV